MQMFDDKEQNTGIGGVTVKDAWIGLQILERAAGSGVLQTSEFTVLGEWRKNMTDAIQRSIGKDYDTEVARLRQMQQEAQKKAQAANAVVAEVAAENEGEAPVEDMPNLKQAEAEKKVKAAQKVKATTKPAKKKSFGA